MAADDKRSPCAEYAAPDLSDFDRGFVAGLAEAAAMVMKAPVSISGQRIAAGPGAFPRMADTAVHPDGDPNYVHCTYALRDAVLYWIEKKITYVGQAHEVTAEPVRKMAGVVGYRFVCSCGRRGNGWHSTPEKAVRAGHDHVPQFDGYPASGDES